MEVVVQKARFNLVSLVICMFSGLGIRRLEHLSKDLMSKRLWRFASA